MQNCDHAQEIELLDFSLKASNNSPLTLRTISHVYCIHQVQSTAPWIEDAIYIHCWKVLPLRVIAAPILRGSQCCTSSCNPSPLPPSTLRCPHLGWRDPNSQCSPSSIYIWTSSLRKPGRSALNTFSGGRLLPLHVLARHGLRISHRGTRKSFIFQQHRHRGAKRVKDVQKWSVALAKA